MTFWLCYEVGLILLALILLPAFLYQFICKKKYRKSILQRFGVGFPYINKGSRPLIWIHAVSLGETKAIAPLVKLIHEEFNNPIILFSTTTETGQNEASNIISADYRVYLPFDFGWVINRIVKRIKPDLVILCESDFWINFIRASKKNGANVAVVNGKISVRSQQRMLKFPFFTEKLFSSIDLFCVQSNLYRKRFESLGVISEKIVVTGNMKFDGDYTKLHESHLHAWREELGISTKDKVVVVGSTHNPEELLILEVMKSVWKKFPDVKVMFVPRHPERFNEVASMLHKNEVEFRRLSQRKLAASNRVILVDAMGVLRKCYQLADIAIVAGSYNRKIGGHNILEPSWYGVPVIFGPYMQNQPDLVDLMQEYGAGLQVYAEDLTVAIIKLLEDSVYRQTIGAAGLRLVGDIHGATAKTITCLKKLHH